MTSFTCTATYYSIHLLLCLPLYSLCSPTGPPAHSSSSSCTSICTPTYDCICKTYPVHSSVHSPMTSSTLPHVPLDPYLWLHPLLQASASLFTHLRLHPPPPVPFSGLLGMRQGSAIASWWSSASSLLHLGEIRQTWLATMLMNTMLHRSYPADHDCCLPALTEIRVCGIIVAEGDWFFMHNA